jgi:hypothetical protein
MQSDQFVDTNFKLQADWLTCKICQADESFRRQNASNARALVETNE